MISGRLADLRRHPLKGFTPERLDAATLQPGARFPGDRLYAVENGPSGFDPNAPAHVSRNRCVVLAHVPVLARIRTRFDEPATQLTVEADGRARLAADLSTEPGRIAFAAWLTDYLTEVDPDALRGPSRVLDGGGRHHFMDDPVGHVSALNLASVRDLERTTGVPVDPDRFRANLHVEGWPAWAELQIAAGAVLTINDARLTVVAPIRRCAAIDANPVTGERDTQLSAELFARQGDMLCGLYLQVEQGGRITRGDAVTLS